MAGGTVTQTWSGSYSRDPVVYVAGPPPLAPLAVPVANTAGQWLFALVSWRQDAGHRPGSSPTRRRSPSPTTPGTSGSPSSVVPADTGVVRCAVWMAPAARAAEYVFASPARLPVGRCYRGDQVLIQAADCPWYAVTATASGSDQPGHVGHAVAGPGAGFFSLGDDRLRQRVGVGQRHRDGLDGRCRGSRRSTAPITPATWCRTPGYLTSSGSTQTHLGVQRAPRWTGLRSSSRSPASRNAAGRSRTALPLENWPVLITEIAAGPVLNSNPLILQRDRRLDRARTAPSPRSPGRCGTRGRPTRR